jgi:integrase
MPGRRQQGEGSLYHRKSRGQWVAVADLGWKAGKRDRREFTGPTPEAALGRRARFLDARRDGFTLPKGRPLTVADWVLHWCHNIARPKVDPNTWYRSYRQKCEDYIAPFFAQTRLATLAEEDIEAWHQWMAARAARRGGTLAPGTVVTAHRILSAALNVAVARRKLPHNPAAFVPPPKATRPVPEPPGGDEVTLILDACRDRPGGARWVLAVCTGLRQGEALGLRWRDVRLTSPAAVTVRQSLARVGGEAVMKEPKSAKSRRTVPLPAIAAQALKAHREAQTVTALRDGLVFTREDGQPVHSRADWQEWRDLLAGLGLPHYRVHDLRHAYATMLLEQGMDSRVVQDLMGWSSARMAEIYQHVRPAMHERAVAALDQILGS